MEAEMEVLVGVEAELGLLHIEYAPSAIIITLTGVFIASHVRKTENSVKKKNRYSKK